MSVNTQPSQGQGSPLLQVSVNAADLLGIFGVLVSLLCAALLKKIKSLGNQMKELQRPALLLPKEMNRVQQLLAQLGVLTSADRVLLGLYHNGSLSPEGYHMSKLQVLAAYYAPGISPVSEYLRVLPIDSIPELIWGLWKSQDGIMTVNVNDESLTSGCRSYMELRDIKCLRNVTLRAGTQVEVGVLGFHYCRECCPSTDLLRTPEVEKVIAEIAKLSTLRNKHVSVLGNLHLQR